MTNNDAIEVLEQMRAQISNDYRWLALDRAIAVLKGIEDTARPQGEWILDWRDDLDAMSRRGWKCSCCSWRTSYGTPRFCMNCGAEMKEGAK